MDEQTQEWVVTFTFASALDEGSVNLIEDAFPPDLDASVSAAPPDRVMVTLHLRAADAPGADAPDVVAIADKLLQLHYPPIFGPQVAVEAVTEAEHERRAEAPTLPELVGASEVATMLGVTRQRVHQLREHPTFPAPLVEVAMGPLWDARAVEAFARAWNRRPGRPPLAAAQ